MYVFFKDGLTPAHLAADKGHTKSLSALIAAGADINLKDEVFPIYDCLRLQHLLPFLFSHVSAILEKLQM